MKYPERYKDREELIASLTDEVIEELRYMEFKINNWNDDVGLNRIPTDKNPARKERQRVFIHREDFDKFAKAFAEVAYYVKNSDQ